MSETTRDGKDRRHARIGALTGAQRGFLLDFLVGYAPEAADTALDDLEGARVTIIREDVPRPWQAAAQDVDEALAGVERALELGETAWAVEHVRLTRGRLALMIDAFGIGTGREPEDDDG